MRHINEIIIHCAATPPNWLPGATTQDKVNEIRRWHVKERGWSDIGYSHIIDRDGTIALGRPIEKVGAHTKSHNANSVGICLIGGKGGTANDDFSDNFTQAQANALRKLIADLRAEYPTITKVSGHNQYSSKACPCFSVPAWYARKPAQQVSTVVGAQSRSTPAQSRTVQASVVQGASAVGGAVGALNALDGTAQIVALIGCIVIAGMAMFIMRERLRAWSSGWR
jgi:N-acetylmuramoyl-L-alanine amidase